MKLSFTLAHTSFKGVQGWRCHAPLKIPGRVSLFTFCLKEGGIGEKTEGEERKGLGYLENPWPEKSWKMVWRHPMEQPLLQRRNNGCVKFYCQWMFRLQMALSLPTSQHWHVESSPDCGGESSQSKRGRRMERGAAWWDTFRRAWFKNTANLVADNCLTTPLPWQREGVNRNEPVSWESLADIKGDPRECGGDHVSCLPA